jgi:hypothetical protein
VDAEDVLIDDCGEWNAVEDLISLLPNSVPKSEEKKRREKGEREKEMNSK